jgi:hypothetical protein
LRLLFFEFLNKIGKKTSKEKREKIVTWRGENESGRWIGSETKETLNLLNIYLKAPFLGHYLAL